MSGVKARMQEKITSTAFLGESGGEQKYTHLGQPKIFRVIIAQLSVSAVLFVVLQPLGMTFALSALLGGLCYTIPNAYFVKQAFRYRGARSAKLIANSFYRGEAGKLMLAAVAFTLVFTLVKPLNPVALFGAFILVQMVNWFTPLLVRHPVKEK